MLKRSSFDCDKKANAVLFQNGVRLFVRFFEEGKHNTLSKKKKKHREDQFIMEKYGKKEQKF